MSLIILSCFITTALHASSDDSTAAISEFTCEHDTLYTKVELMPRLPPGVGKRHVGTTLDYPVEARDQEIEGEVRVGYVIDSAGFLGTVLVARSSGNKQLDDEAVRVVQAMPGHQPGKHNGRPVAVYMIMPVTFKIE